MRRITVKRKYKNVETIDMSGRQKIKIIELTEEEKNPDNFADEIEDFEKRLTERYESHLAFYEEIANKNISSEKIFLSYDELVSKLTKSNKLLKMMLKENNLNEG